MSPQDIVRAAWFLSAQSGDAAESEAATLARQFEELGVAGAADIWRAVAQAIREMEPRAGVTVH